MVTDGIRNIKSMWEKGSVFNSPGGGGGTYKVGTGKQQGLWNSVWEEVRTERDWGGAEREEGARFTATSCSSSMTTSPGRSAGVELCPCLFFLFPLSTQEAAGMKIGVAGRINDWLNKTPESKTPGGRPAVGRLHDNHLLYSAFVLFALLYLILY